MHQHPKILQHEPTWSPQVSDPDLPMLLVYDKNEWFFNDFGKSTFSFLEPLGPPLWSFLTLWGSLWAPLGLPLGSSWVLLGSLGTLRGSPGAPWDLSGPPWRTLTSLWVHPSASTWLHFKHFDLPKRILRRPEDVRGPRMCTFWLPAAGILCNLNSEIT